MDTKMRFKGRFDLECFDAAGALQWDESIDNLITDGGFDWISGVMFAPTSRPVIISYVAIGSGTTAATAADTTLETELARGQGVYAHTTGTKVATLTEEFAAGTGTGTVAEVGTFNLAAAGVMLSRAILGTARTKAAEDSLRVTYTFTLSQQ